jgi:hypothetical protein
MLLHFKLSMRFSDDHAGRKVKVTPKTAEMRSTYKRRKQENRKWNTQMVMVAAMVDGGGFCQKPPIERTNANSKATSTETGSAFLCAF